MRAVRVQKAGAPEARARLVSVTLHESLQAINRRHQNVTAGVARIRAARQPSCLAGSGPSYHGARTHLFLAKDAPEPRRVERFDEGGSSRRPWPAACILATVGERRKFLSAGCPGHVDVACRCVRLGALEPIPRWLRAEPRGSTLGVRRIRGPRPRAGAGPKVPGSTKWKGQPVLRHSDARGGYSGRSSSWPALAEREPRGKVEALRLYSVRVRELARRGRNARGPLAGAGQSPWRSVRERRACSR